MQLTVNGKQYELDVESDMPLLWVLRDELGFTSVKYGCGMALCGACTVNVGGQPVRSCQIPASIVWGEIETVESLGNETSPHPLQAAWIKHQVPQCGYCQSGQLMTAAKLLKDNPNPSESDIKTAMHGNLCRCGTYPRIKIAIIDAAESMKEDSE